MAGRARGGETRALGNQEFKGREMALVLWYARDAQDEEFLFVYCGLYFRILRPFVMTTCMQNAVSGGVSHQIAVGAEHAVTQHAV